MRVNDSSSRIHKDRKGGEENQEWDDAGVEDILEFHSIAHGCIETRKTLYNKNKGEKRKKNYCPDKFPLLDLEYKNYQYCKNLQWQLAGCNMF